MAKSFWGRLFGRSSHEVIANQAIDTSQITGAGGRASAGPHLVHSTHPVRDEDGHIHMVETRDEVTQEMLDAEQEGSRNYELMQRLRPGAQDLLYNDDSSRVFDED